MKFLPQGASIVFLGTAGIGSGSGPTAPQIKMFDVYYIDAPIVGFHVIGDEDDE